MRNIVKVLVAALLAACTSDDIQAPPENPSSVTWTEDKPEGFSYTLSFSCECLPHDAGPFSVRATRDSVIEAYRLLPGGDSVRLTTGIQRYSIDSLLARVTRALAEDPDTAIIQYDSLYGFPSSVFVDFKIIMADEELSFSVTGFHAGPVAPTPLSWKTHRPEKFAYIYQRWCFCFGDYVAPYSVVATRDSVLSVWKLKFSGSNVSDSTRITLNPQVYSIDTVLTEYGRRLSSGYDSVWIYINPTYGYPVELGSDFSYETADDEGGFTIRNFRALMP